MSFDVFISYSTTDMAIANAVKQALQAEGVRCWKAPEDVIPDSNTHYAAQIVEAIERCPVMVLIWSISSMESLEVSKELSVAMDAKTTVIPFRIEDIKPEGSFKYHLQGVHWLDMFDKPLENALQDLYSQVSANLDAKRLIREKRIQTTRESSEVQPSTCDMGGISSEAASATSQSNSSLAQWKEALWWLARNGTLRPVDRAALMQLALKTGLNINIDSEVSSLSRDPDLFKQAIGDVVSSGRIDTLSAIGLDSIRLDSCISIKEATELMRQLCQSSNGVSIEDGIEMPWIMDACAHVSSKISSESLEPGSSSDDSFASQAPAESDDTVVETNDARTRQRHTRRIKTVSSLACELASDLRPQNDIDKILGLDESDVEALGVWHTSLSEAVSWDELIHERLSSFCSSSDILQIFPGISGSLERKVSGAHEIPLGSAGRLLLRVNASSFSGKNGLLIFDECLSVKQFWEKAKHYSFYDRTSETRLQAEATPLDRGFSLIVSRSRHKNHAGKADSNYAFDDLLGWISAVDCESFCTELPELIKLLASKQERKWDCIRALNMIQEILSLHMMIVGTSFNLLGAAELANQQGLAGNAANSICSGSVDSAELLMVIDKSIPGNCKSGIALSPRGIHRKETLISRSFIPWGDVESILLTDENQLCVNNESLIEFPAIRDSGSPIASSEDLEDQSSSWARATACFFFACAEIFSGHELKNKDSLSEWIWALANYAYEADWIELALALLKRFYSNQAGSNQDREALIVLIALCLLRLERFAECASMRTFLYQQSASLNGADHPDTHQYAYELAEALSAGDRRIDAIPLRRRELAWCRQQNGDTDSGTLTSINGLAIDLRETGELKEAEALFRELVAGRQQVLEPSDFQIGRALGGLAKTLEAAGKLEEAAAYARQALEHRLEHQGPDDFSTNVARLDLARLLHKLGRVAEANTLLDQLEKSMDSMDAPDDADRQLQEEAAALRSQIQSGP